MTALEIQHIILQGEGLRIEFKEASDSVKIFLRNSCELFKY